MTDLRNIVLIGAGGHACACIDVIERTGTHKIAGLVGVPEEVGQSVLGYKVIGSDDHLENIALEYQLAHISAGQIKSAALRKRLFERAIGSGFEFPAIISPGAWVSPHAKIGRGSIFMNGAVINAGASVGENCIINSGSIVEHGAKIGDFCHISTGAIINGDVVVGSESFIGSRTVLKEGISVGSNCIVGMGLSLKTDIPGQSTLK